MPDAVATCPDATFVEILGVTYLRTETEEGGELYLTTHGLEHAEHLQPENWYDLDWFRTHRVVLEGTGAVYATPTKPVDGRSLGLVVKYNRVGQRVPLGTDAMGELFSLNFNSPFEEFALVEAMRLSRFGPADRRVRTQLPLAIFVPPERYQPSQLGRDRWRVAQKVARYPGVAIDILREYVMVFTWVPGVDAHQALEMGLLSEPQHDKLVGRAVGDMSRKGFQVLDMKPSHVIVDLEAGGELIRRDGEIRWSVIDYELLERTEEHEKEARAARLDEYLRRQGDPFGEGDHAPPRERAALPPHLHAVEVLGVDYLHGPAGSTGGALWVVGDVPELFDYFVPERWRTTTPQVRMLPGHETYFTRTKDDIPLVWRISRVGERPSTAGYGRDGYRVLSYGFNSPFEELSLVRHLRRCGVPTVLPRAIYQTGLRPEMPESLFDPTRFESHKPLQAPDGQPILQPRSNYITLWSTWHGPDPLLGAHSDHRWESLNLGHAAERGLVAAEEVAALLEQLRARLLAAGIEALRLKPAHVLVAADADGELCRDADGAIELRLCNFQLLRRLDTSHPHALSQ